MEGSPRGSFQDCLPVVNFCRPITGVRRHNLLALPRPTRLLQPPLPLPRLIIGDMSHRQLGGFLLAVSSCTGTRQNFLALMFRFYHRLHVPKFARTISHHTGQAWMICSFRIQLLEMGWCSFMSKLRLVYLSFLAFPLDCRRLHVLWAETQWPNFPVHRFIDNQHNQAGVFAHSSLAAEMLLSMRRKETMTEQDPQLTAEDST